MELPIKPSIRYPEQANIRISQETKEKILRLKQMGVDTGKLLRVSICDIVDKALDKLDKQAG